MSMRDRSICWFLIVKRPPDLIPRRTHSLIQATPYGRSDGDHGKFGAGASSTLFVAAAPCRVFERRLRILFADEEHGLLNFQAIIERQKVCSFERRAAFFGIGVIACIRPMDTV